MTNLDNLTKEEREAVAKILEEMSSNGLSDTYDKLLYADYKEVPVDIETFLTNDYYLGRAWKDSEGNLKIYPKWLKIVKQLFPDNTTTSVNNFIASGARGIGKSEISVGVIAAYMMYRMMCLKNPLEYYGLKPTEKICFAFMNIKKDLAEEIATDKFQKTVQLSPWFMSKGYMTKRNNADYWVPPDPITIIIGSQSSDVIGLPIAFAFFDEISFIRNLDVEKQKQKAIDMIDTALGGMKTRFIKDGKNPTLLALASSKRSEKSFLEEHIKQKLKSEQDNVIIVDMPVWEMKPAGTYSGKTFKVAVGNKYLESLVLQDNEDTLSYLEKGYKIINVPVELRASFLDDIDRALCDYAGISSSDLSKYISGAMVSSCVIKEKQNAFTQEVLEIGNAPDDNLQYYNFFDKSRIDKDLLSKPLFIHLDMSISGDTTGIAGVTIKGKKPSTTEDQSKDLLYSLVFSVAIKAPKGRQVSFEKNRNFIRWLKEQGFKIKEITADTFQSYDLLQILSAEGFNCNILSVDRVDTNRICQPYNTFKNAIYENRIQFYNSKRLLGEIIDLERNINSGKVDHPPNGHKDTCDAVCGATFTASKHAEEFAYDYGESLNSFVDLNDESLSPEDMFVNDLKEQNKPKSLDFGFGPAEEYFGSDDGILIW